jgi:tetratricopeptide (TPR) repeat protein
MKGSYRTRLKPCAVATTLASILLLPFLFTPTVVASTVSARAGQLEIPTYPWTAVRHPYFRGTDKVNIYPYRMLDFLSREKTPRVYRTVILENEYLKITFLPELGGKIHEVINKTTGQPVFYVNHVIKPGLIGQCGAWTSGGVEWNTGPQGHTVSCMLPMDVVILPPEPDGSRSVAVGETERIYGTRWTVVVTLRPGRYFIEEQVRIYNPTQTVRPYYFWNCTASPNTPGFRFIYPMTLGCDHAGEKFFKWPVDHGKDLTLGVNYVDASSIFAWHCDRDFFGSYNDDLGRGVVACANHQEVPGKKAWTWGQGGFGKMHQMDLTDDDGPYNEVQTGPLLTQAQVGRLEPSEAVQWREFWYPVHGIGGFSFANPDVAINATREDGKLRLQMLGTGTWRDAEVRVFPAEARTGARAACPLSPKRPVDVTLSVPEASRELMVELNSGPQMLAKFEFPLRLPERQPPSPKPKAEDAAGLVEAGWEDFLFARFSEAESKFKRAVEKDPGLASASTGLALLSLSRDPAAARKHAETALEASPGSGLAHVALASALLETDEQGALDHAWQAALDPAAAVAGRGLAARILLSRRDWQGVIEALDFAGAWQEDPICRDYLAFARFQAGQKETAVRLARATLLTEPLDTFALAVLWLADARGSAQALRERLGGKAQPILQLASALLEIGQHEIALRIINEFYLEKVAPGQCDPLVNYWATALGKHAPALVKANLPTAGSPTGIEGVLPYTSGDLQVLRECVRENPRNARSAQLLGDVLFHFGAYAEARDHWKRAAELDPKAVTALRALGMAARNVNNDLPGARNWLERANQADPTDPIVARDLARVLFDLADKAEAAEKTMLVTEARDCLKTAFPGGKGRSDFVALFGRAQNRLGDYAETARMLDVVRVTVWEGAHEVHDLFEQAHMALGEAHLKEGRPAEALKEFNRALEYPANLATGKLENAREEHIHYQRGNALAALGRKEDAAAAWKLAASERESGDKRINEARQNARKALEELKL